MWDLRGPGLEPVSPALAGGFLTTVPPVKPWQGDFQSIHNEDSVLVTMYCLIPKYPEKSLEGRFGD